MWQFGLVCSLIMLKMCCVANATKFFVKCHQICIVACSSTSPLCVATSTSLVSIEQVTEQLPQVGCHFLDLMAHPYDGEVFKLIKRC